MLELSYSYHDRHSQIEVHYSGNKKIIAVYMQHQLSQYASWSQLSISLIQSA